MGESRTAVNIVAESVRFVSGAALGLFAGAMLTEAYILVPYWRSLPPAEFFTWYAANDRRLFGYFAPLTAVTALLAIAAAIASMWERHPRRWLTVLAAALSVAAVSTFFVYFREVNAAFAAGSLGADEVAAELTRWASWHRWRTGMSMVALAAGLLSLWPTGRKAW